MSLLPWQIRDANTLGFLGACSIGLVLLAPISCSNPDGGSGSESDLIRRDRNIPLDSGDEAPNDGDLAPDEGESDPQTDIHDLPPRDPLEESIDGVSDLPDDRHDSPVGDLGDLTCPDPVTPIDIVAGTYSGLRSCGCEFYLIPLEEGSTIRAEIRFEHDRCDFDLTLFEPDRSSILSASTTDDDVEEVLAFVVRESGEYLLRVCCGEEPGTPYDLQVEVWPELGQQVDLIGRTTQVVPLETGALTVQIEVLNLGGFPADSNTAHLFLSEDETVSGSDLILAERQFVDGIPAASRRRDTFDIELSPEIAPGIYYFGVTADALSVIDEADETNNTTFHEFELLE